MKRSLVVMTAAWMSLAWTGWSAADAVRLRTTAAVERGASVTLGEVAVLEGAAAERWSGLVVLERAEPAEGGSDGAWVEISLDAVRSALAEAGAGGALLGFSGDRCLVRLRGVRVVTEAPAEGGVSERSAEIVDVTGEPTVRTRFAALLAEIYDVSARDLRLSFPASAEELLSMSEHGRRIVVRPTTSGSSVRASAEVRVVSGETTVASGTVSADVEVRRSVLVAGGEIERGGLVQEGMVREVEMWVTPGGGEATELGQAVGRTVRARVREGDVLRLGDLEAPIVVRRGDLVSVLALNGGVSVQVKARARSDGRVGERIELRLEGSRRSFVARVDGPGRAVIVLDSGTPVADGE